ncbi:uncharacterized protein V1516DRAFT_675727 [Lipomyces oligophaga]|uniref:uncharacterized protein n=1 Tax=Lipomyces oligophaga TaxID=45792 RepID=UPI0034CE2D58
MSGTSAPAGPAQNQTDIRLPPPLHLLRDSQPPSYPNPSPASTFSLHHPPPSPSNSNPSSASSSASSVPSAMLQGRQLPPLHAALFSAPPLPPQHHHHQHQQPPQQQQSPQQHQQQSPIQQNHPYPQSVNVLPPPSHHLPQSLQQPQSQLPQPPSHISPPPLSQPASPITVTPSSAKRRPTRTRTSSTGSTGSVASSTSISSASAPDVDALGRKKPKTPRNPSSWDPHDDLILRHLKERQKLGWKDIANHFPGRTPNACQFRWRRLMSGSLRGCAQAAEPANGSAVGNGPANPTNGNGGMTPVSGGYTSMPPVPMWGSPMSASEDTNGNFHLAPPQMWDSRMPPVTSNGQTIPFSNTLPPPTNNASVGGLQPAANLIYEDPSRKQMKLTELVHQQQQTQPGPAPIIHMHPQTSGAYSSPLPGNIPVLAPPPQFIQQMEELPHKPPHTYPNQSQPAQSGSAQVQPAPQAQMPVPLQQQVPPIQPSTSQQQQLDNTQYHLQQQQPQLQQQAEEQYQKQLMELPKPVTEITADQTSQKSHEVSNSIELEKPALNAGASNINSPRSSSSSSSSDLTTAHNESVSTTSTSSPNETTSATAGTSAVVTGGKVKSEELGQAKMPTDETSEPVRLISKPIEKPAGAPWSVEEDDLLIRRDLRFEELSVLLPGRTEKEIWDRISSLQNQGKVIAAASR